MAQVDQTQVSESQDNGMTSPSLIGTSSALSDTSPAYFNAVKVDSRVCSIDMMRVSVKFKDEEWAYAHADILGGEVTWNSMDRKIGHYRHAWTYAVGDSSVMLGVGLNCPSGKVDMRSGVIEWNPNKTGHDPNLFELLGRIAPHTASSRVKRYDLAMDVPIDRNNCRATKDRRAYRPIVGNGITEYLGKKHEGGYVKVYDKQVESGLSVPLTRIELTCDGAWTARDVVKHWPVVHAWTVPDGTKDWVKVMGMLLSEKVARGEEVETYIAMLGRGSRPKVRECCRSGVIELPMEVAQYAVNQSIGWANLLTA